MVFQSKSASFLTYQTQLGKTLALVIKQETLVYMIEIHTIETKKARISSKGKRAL